MPDTTNEPLQLRAGDTWQWRREDLAADYPASAGWALTYRFKNASGGFEVTASADGDAFAITVTAATTATYAAGSYAWAAQVAKSPEKYTVDSGTLEVLPNLFSGTATAASDQRSHARIVLDAIEAVIEGRASKDQEEYSIGNRTLKRTPISDMLKLHSRYKAMVASEEAADKLRNGLQAGRVVQVRF